MVGLGGGRGMDGAGRRPPCQIVPETSVFNCSDEVVGDKNERGKALSVNVERGAVFL